MSLTVRVTHQSGRIANVQTELQRPLLPLGQWLAQGDEDRALQSLPLLFSVCGQAHGVAGRLALGVAVTPQQLHLAQLESLREYLIRLMKNWHYPVDATALGRWMQMLAADNRQPDNSQSEKDHLVEQQSDMTERLAGWQALLPNRMEEADWLKSVVTGWQDRFGGIQLNPLSGTSAFEPGKDATSTVSKDNALLMLAGSGLSAWCDQTTQSSISAIEWLSVGLNALLSDMHRTAANLTSSLEERAQSISRTCSHGSLHRQRLRATETGIEREGWFKTSRGWLCHRVQMADSGERIGWQIEAPTDVNFTRPELLQQLLSDVSLEAAQTKPLVQALVTLIDPCVACDVETLTV